jgi:hypothetical protein
MLKFLALSLLAISFAAITGCSSGKPVAGWFGGSDEISENENSTFYATAAGASVFAKASPESRLLGKLKPYERVTRIGEAKGFAHIRARSGSMVGWVHASRLSRRLPTRPKASSESTGAREVPPPGEAPADTNMHPADLPDAAKGPDEPEARNPPVSQAAGAPAPAVEPEPAGPQKPRGVGASVFDPY